MATTPEASQIQARCPRHPERPATGVCERCGGFLCELDRVVGWTKSFCPSCAANPEVDYVERFRLDCWGRRDGWAWVIGVLSVPIALVASIGVYEAATTRRAHFLEVAVPLIVSATGVAFWLGVRWARQGLILVPAALGAVAAATEGPLPALTLVLFPLWGALSIYLDVRNQLFFKVSVPRKKLEKAWRQHRDNTVAHAGFLFALVGLLPIGLGLVGLILSIIGLMRVDPNAHPPVGRRGEAIAGVVLGTIGTLEAVALGAYLLGGR